MTAVAIVYHSASGRTRAVAEAVARGASAHPGTTASLHPVPEVDEEALITADAIIFGCPTYMGSASAAFKTFMDSTSTIWALQGWRDKLAAGFTHSAAPSGDKLGTLMQLAVFAAQHGMVWIGLGLPPTYAGLAPEGSDTNRLGSHLGAMTQSTPGGAGVPESDLATAEHLGRRVAEATRRWIRGVTSGIFSPQTSPGPVDPRLMIPVPATAAPQPVAAPIAPASAITAVTPPEPSGSETPTDPRVEVARHPATLHWRFPPADRPPLPAPLQRTNLRELAARADRFEHQLIICATLGRTQLEIATASEPLYFGHVNFSDEYSMALPTGDSIVDRLPHRTLLTSIVTGNDVGRYNHRTGDLVLNPVGYMHWPGRLRPPYEQIGFPPGTRRCGLSLVFCAGFREESSAPMIEAPPERAEDLKAYVAPAPPMMLAPMDGPPGTLARIHTTEIALVDRRGRIAPPRGGWVIVLAADPAVGHFPCDLIRIPAGASLDARGISRALVLSDPFLPPDPPPPSWQILPPPPFAPFEEAPPGALPFNLGPFSVEATRSGAVAVTVRNATAAVPRYWLARTLYRVALHGLRLGYVETYGGLFLDDHPPRNDGAIELGLRTSSGRVAIAIAASDALDEIEQLYRAVAPTGYRERLS